MSTVRLGPVSPRDSGRVTNGSEGVGGGGFGGFGEGVILIDLIPLSISLSGIVLSLSPSTARILLLPPREAGRVKVGFGLAGVAAAGVAAAGPGSG